VSLNSAISFVDAHCHLNFDDFDPDRDQVVRRAWESGIRWIINPGIDIETSKTALKCSYDYPQVFAAVGVHPNTSLSWTQSSLSELKRLAGEEKVVAIGEIGLDYYRDYAPRELQRSIFIKQLELAAELELPVIIHNREASEDVTDILKNWQEGLLSKRSNLADHPGELHSFSGTLELAQEMVAHNFKIGITGPVTFRNSQILQSVVRGLSLENLIIETDAPYLSPHPYRGKRNEPANVRIVAEKVAELKSISVEHVAKSTTEEAGKLFNWREIH
jgi:TatD DNase family protein